jgi:hypothetical protein
MGEANEVTQLVQNHISDSLSAVRLAEGGAELASI